MTDTTEYPSFKNLISENILKVSELNSRIKKILDKEFKKEYLWIEGEISNFKGNYSSGHWYFSLKDEKSLISAVCFRGNNQHIKFKPKDGQEVICCGQISIYEKSGTCQINVTYIEPKGIGAQRLALEQLKEKLKSEGLFDPGRKRQLPFLSRKIGVITSPTGAVIRDIIKVTQRRSSNTQIIVSPARVQGKNAPSEISKALRLLYRINDLDLIIVARGGGSSEDLWVFNEELVAREISISPFPTISAVGHETDVTIADLVADLRAATPSAAAELAVKDRNELLDELKNFSRRINSSLSNRIGILTKDLDHVKSELIWSIKNKRDTSRSQLNVLVTKLNSISPLNVLGRGYSIVQDRKKEHVIKSSKDIKTGDKLSIQFHIGKADCTVDKVTS